jgi:hypothetical protein
MRNADGGLSAERATEDSPTLIDVAERVVAFEHVLNCEHNLQPRLLAASWAHSAFRFPRLPQRKLRLSSHPGLSSVARSALNPQSTIRVPRLCRTPRSALRIYLPFSCRVNLSFLI